MERVRLSRQVRLAAAKAPVAEVPRLTVAGHFQLRDMPLVVVVDGTPVGRAVEAPDLASATVVLPAESLAHDGARVSFRYGPEGPDTAVGTLKAAR